MKYLRRLLLVLIGLLQLNNSFAYDFEVDGIYYNILSESEVEVTNKAVSAIVSGFYSGDVVIPEKVTYSGNTYRVTAIGEYAFYHCENTVNSITLPNTIVKIGMSAFSSLWNIEEITIPSSVTTISGHAFSSCKKLASIVISDNVISIGEECFYHCDNLQTVKMGKSVKTLGSSVFAYCGKLESVILSNNLESIGSYAFSNCSNLSYIEIPNSVTAIGSRAFYQCTNLHSLVLSQNLIAISEMMFDECKSLESIDIPNSVISIGRLAFDRCQNLKTINNSSSLKSIEASAFLECYNLQSIVLPTTLQSIGDGAFMDCPSLALVISKSKDPFKLEAKNLFYLGSSTMGLYHGRTLQIPKGTKQKYIDNGWTGHFNEVEEIGVYYNFLISVSENGSATYDDTTLRNQTQSFEVEEGSSTTVTFTPDTGYRIASVKVNGTDITTNVVSNTYTITNISADVTLAVTFEAITHMLSITASGNGSATYNSTAIRGKTQTFTVNEGSSATVTFTPDAGYRIASVKVNGTDVTSSVDNNEYTISKITANTTLAVTFEAIPLTTYTLSVTSSGNGSAYYNNTTIRNKTEVFTVNEGTSATVTFAPDAGYRIASVKLNNTGVTASVANNSYTISNITANTTLTVTFEEIPPTTYALTISAVGNGTVTYDGNTIKGKTSSFTVVEDTNVVVTFSADDGNRLKSVKLGNTDVTSSVVNNQYTISNIKADTSLEVTFEAIPTYSLNITASGNGNATYNGTAVRGKTQTFTVNEGTSAIVTFAPDAGYRIASVKLNSTDVTASVANNSYTISNITANTTLTVTFEEIPPTTYALTISAVGNGTVTYDGNTIKGKTSSFTVVEDTNVVVTFSADDGNRLKSVKLGNTDVTSSVVNNQYTISNIKANTSLEVTFEAIPTYSLNITASGNGNATYNGTAVRGKTQSFTVIEGTTATVTFAPDAGYRIASLKLNNTDVTASVANNSYTISNITANTTLAVTFEEIPPTTYALTISAIGNGTVTYDGNTVRGKTSSFTVVEGTNAVVTFSADDGNRLKSVKLGNTDVTSSVVNNQYTISNIKADTSLEVTFEAIPTYSLNITASGNGSATYNSTAVRGKTQSFTVNEGTSATVTFTPDAGYRIASLKLNGTDVTSSVANGRYTISNIKSDNTLKVEFEAIPPSTYMLNIVAVGNGSVSYNNTTIRNQSKEFTVVEESNVTITISPDKGYRLASVIVNEVDVTANVSNNHYTISNISEATNIEVKFEAITHIMDIIAKGNGTAIYSGTTIRDNNDSFTITEGSSASIRFTPDAGHKIKSVLLNDVNVTSDVINNVYTISNITRSNILEVEFEAIMHTLTIKATGNGSVSYNDISFSNQSKSFKLKEGVSTVISITPDSGYRIKSVTVNSTDMTSQVTNGQITISNIAQDTNVEVTFEEIPPTTYSLTITAAGNGAVTYDGQSVRGGSSTFTVVEGSYATVQIGADDGYRLKRVMLDGKDVTADVTTGQYTTTKIMADMTLAVEFEEAFTELAYNGVNYKAVSYEEQKVNVVSGNYGLTLTVPATFEADGKTWTVAGIDNGALANATELAAIIWDPEVAFTAQVSNPNLLLYVKKAEYAPSTIQNVVVGNQAESIVLKEAAEDNNFCCPRAFTAQRISYSHNYSMRTGYQTCQGWETIVLPFDVTMITNAKGTELVPYVAWQDGNSQRPFWLYQLTESGWQASNALKANVPYIISMPNNELYHSSYNQSGYIEFVGSNIQVATSDQVTTGQHGNKRLVANYQVQEASSSILALNVSNEWHQNTATEKEGSTFIRSLRIVHPFEAYMTVEDSNAPWTIPVFDNDVPTDIVEMERMRNGENEEWYDLQGRKLQGEPKKNGIYLHNGKKVRK